MAITATMSLDNDCVGNRGLMNLTVKVSNSGAAAVTLVSLIPQLAPTAPVAQGIPLPGPGASIPAGGSTNFVVGVVPFNDAGANQTEVAYSLNAVIQTSDGSVIQPSNGPLQFTASSESNPLPVAGQVRGDSNNQSGLNLPGR